MLDWYSCQTCYPLEIKILLILLLLLLFLGHDNHGVRAPND